MKYIDRSTHNFNILGPNKNGGKGPPCLNKVSLESGPSWSWNLPVMQTNNW